MSARSAVLSLCLLCRARKIVVLAKKKIKHQEKVIRKVKEQQGSSDQDELTGEPTMGEISLVPRPHPLREGRSGAQSPNSWLRRQV